MSDTHPADCIARYRAACARARSSQHAFADGFAALAGAPIQVVHELVPATASPHFVANSRVAATATRAARFLFATATTLLRAPFEAAFRVVDLLVVLALCARHGPIEIGVRAFDVFCMIRRIIWPAKGAQRALLWLMLFYFFVVPHLRKSVRSDIDCHALMDDPNVCGKLHEDGYSACIRANDGSFLALRDWHISSRDQNLHVVLQTVDGVTTKALMAKSIFVTSRTPDYRVVELTGAAAYCAQKLENDRKEGGP